MSLYSYLPHLSHDDFDGAARPEERTHAHPGGEVLRILGKRDWDSRHVVAFSLTLPGVGPGSGVPSLEEQMKSEAGCADGDRASICERLVGPLLSYGPLFNRLAPEVVMRIYLAADLSFLAETLSENFEVCLMAGDSFSAGYAFWPYLGMSETSETYNVISAADFPAMLDRIEIARVMKEGGLGLWRTPLARDLIEDAIAYAPMKATDWGTSVCFPVEESLAVFRSALERGSLGIRGTTPWDGIDRPVHGCGGDSGGLALFFLTTCVFPRIAASGVLTVPPKKPDSRFLLLDLEFCNWINASSSCVFELEKFLSGPREGFALPLLRAAEGGAGPAFPYYRAQVPA